MQEQPNDNGKDNDNNFNARYLNISLPEIRERDRFTVDAPR